jgi:hypothetical protein
VALALAFFSGAAPIAGADAPAQEPVWDATVFGFGWLSSLQADLSIGPATANLDLGIDELIPKLTWVVAGGFEARYERVLFSLDALGQQIQTTERSPGRTVQLDPLGGVFSGLTGTRDPSSASIRATEVMAEATLGWRALSVPVSSLFSSVAADDPRRIRLDLLGGARYWYWRNELRLSIPPVTIRATNPPPIPPGIRGRLRERVLDRLDLPTSIAVGGSNGVFETTASWIDPIIGFRVGGDVSESVSLNLRADIGGFGLGDSSDFSWQVMPGVQWRFADHWVVAANWRAIGFDRNIVSDAVLYGALLGIGYRF